MNEQTFDNSRDNGNSLSRSDSSNMILAEECPGFKYYIPATRTRTGEPQNIHESIKEGPPSEGFHKDFYWIVKVGDPSGETREPIQVTADLSVDDLGEFSMGPLKISLPEQGPNGGSSGQSDSASGKLPPGFYCATLSYDNIDYKKNANKAFLEFSLNASPGKAVPEDNEDNAGDCERDDCDCQKGAQNENTTQPGGEEGAPASRKIRSAEWASSSGGKNITATISKNNMLWQANFGTFRGMGGVPGGMLEITAKNFSETAWSIHSLAYNHPMASRLEKPSGSSYIGQPNTMVKVVSGTSKHHYLIGGDGNSIFGAGVSTGTTTSARVQYGSSGETSHIEFKTHTKSSTIYSTVSGMPSSYNTWSGKQISSSEFARYLDIVKAEDGSLRQIWNLWDGVANIENISENGYSIALYLPNQVGVKDNSTGLYQLTGEPFKSFDIGPNEERDRIIVTERAAGRPPYVVSWWQAGGAWSMSKGTGEDEIVTLVEREELGGNRYRLTAKVKRGMEGEVVSCTSETFSKTDEGTQRNDKTMAYGSPISRKTTYSYDDAGRGNVVDKNASTKDNIWSSGYDTHSRPTVSYEPWAGGTRKAIYTYYKDGDFYDSDIDHQRIALVKEGNATQYRRINYKYSTVNHVRRVEKRTTALGSGKTQFEATETWLGTAPNPHAQGRIKFHRDINGVQTAYTYEPNNSYGSLYKVTKETQVSGKAVHGQSTRQIRYVSAQGNDMRIEDYVLLSNGTWKLVEAMDYEYDCENRWIKRTRANGRITEREMMCCGPLWERDEDGILTTYSYNTARQLVEVIRSATETTPEMITSYTRDAMDRILETRVDIGPMTTITRTSYDLLGRRVSYTDKLGRVTTYSYSEDGLTTTETTPTGATLITRKHADGTLLEQSGTGQRHLIYMVEALKNGVRTTISTPSPEGSAGIVLSRETVDGFGQTVKKELPNTEGGWIVTDYVYNEKGQKTQEQTVGLAPILYDYDTMGNLIRETVKLDDSPTKLNSRITEWAVSFEDGSDGVYLKETSTIYTPEGAPVRTSEISLISSTHATLAGKTVIRDTRGNEGVTWTEYSTSAKRIIKRQTPASNTMAEDVLIDGFLISGTDLAGVATTHARIYTEHGLTLINTDVRGNATILEQDVAGRSVKVTNAMGGVTTTSYDPATGKPSFVTDALGNTVCFSYDCRGRKIAEYGTGVQPALYAYDDADNVVSLTTFRAGEEAIVSDPTERTDGDTTTWRYDASTGLLLSKTYADGTSANYEYDSMNRLERSINPRSLAAIRTYAPLTGELLSVICDDSSTTQTPPVTYSYNYLGMPVSVSDGSGTREFIYNQYNELEAEKMQGLVSCVLSNTRDSLGRAAGYSLLCGEETVQAVSYGYDTKGRLGNVSMDGLEAPFNYGYNVNHGLLETLSYPNTLKRWYTREEKRNLLIKVDYLRPGGQNYPAKVDYTYDILGRPMTKMDYFNTPNPDLTHNYTYNERGELVADAMSRGGTYSYVYDNMGNRITGREGTADSSVYASNELNQYVSIIEGTQTPFLPEYDLEGNQTKVKTATGEWSVTYNAFNQAIEFVQGEMRIECLYDYLHRRVEKSVYNGENLVSRKRFIYKDYLQIAELDAANADETVLPILKKTYLWDPVETTATRILAMRNYDGMGSNPENLYFTHDRMKNAIALFGSKAGRRALYEYAPYGAVIKAEGDMALVNPFRFSSEYHDDELGMVYYNYRYLNPLDGRWINRDFVSVSGVINEYVFNDNFVSGYTDILGLSPDYKPYLCNGSTLPPSALGSSQTPSQPSYPKADDILQNIDRKYDKNGDGEVDECFSEKFAKALEQLANDPSVNNYNDFLQALSDGSEKGDFVNQVSEKLAKDLNKEMKTGSKLFNNVDNLFNGDKDATLKRLMHGNTPRNQKNVGFKPEMAANGANNARHFAWALHEGQLGARAAQLMDFAESLIRSGARQQECEAEVESDRAAAGAAKDLSKVFKSHYFDKDTWNKNKSKIADTWRKRFCQEK